LKQVSGYRRDPKPPDETGIRNAEDKANVSLAFIILHSLFDILRFFRCFPVVYDPFRQQGAQGRVQGWKGSDLKLET
jgi:hypothetical protein